MKFGVFEWERRDIFVSKRILLRKKYDHIERIWPLFSNKRFNRMIKKNIF